MHKRVGFCLLLMVLLAVVPAAVAQEEAEQGGEPGDMGGTAAEVVFVTPTAGMEADFEAGVKRHMAWVAEQGGTDTWYGWQIVTGDNTGSYYFGTFGHEWADFDDPDVDRQAASANIAENIDPYVAHLRVSYLSMRPDLSRLSDEMTGPSPMAELVHWKVKLGHTDDLAHVLMKIREAAEESDWPGHWEVYDLRNGGHGPMMTLALPRSSMADMAPDEPNIGQIMEKAFGRFETEDLFDKFAHSVYSEESELIVLRKDLSYMPEGDGM